MRRGKIESLEARLLFATQIFFDLPNANISSGTNFANSPVLSDSTAAAVTQALNTATSQGKPLAVQVLVPITPAGPAAAVFNQFALKYVFADMAAASDITALKQIVAGSTKSKSAFVGQFNFYPGEPVDPTVVVPRPAEFAPLGLTMANEELYPGAADYRSPAAGTNPATGGSSAPNIRSDFFTLPIERLTLASNELYGRGGSLTQTNSGSAADASFAGGFKSATNVPYVSRFNSFGNTVLSNSPSSATTPNPFVSSAAIPADGQLPSRGDFMAQVLHYRMRGADSVMLAPASFLDLSGAAYTDTQQELDLNAGWLASGQPGGGSNTLNSIFATHHYGFANMSSLVSLDTNQSNGAPLRTNSEATGIIYSGVYSEQPSSTGVTVGAAAFRDKFGVFHPAVPASQMVLLISNLGNVTKTVDLGTIAGRRVFTPTDPNGIGQDDITIAPGQHRLVTFTLKNQAGLGLGTIAKQNANGLPVWDLTSNNAVFTLNDRNGTGFGVATRTVVPAAVSLTGPTSVAAGTQFQYTITVTNPGASAVQSLVLSDALPGNATFVSVSQDSGPAFTLSAPTVGQSSGEFDATLSSLDAGASATFTVTLLLKSSVASGTVVSNTVHVLSHVLASPITTSASTSFTTTASSDVSIDLTSASTTPVVEGSNLVYTMTVSNVGPSDAQNVSFDFAVPTGVAFNDTQFVSVSRQSGPTFALTTTPTSAPTSQKTDVKGSIATLLSGMSSVFTITLHVPFFREISATALVTTTSTDPNLMNNSSTDVHDVQDAPLTTGLHPDISGIAGTQLSLVTLQSFADANPDQAGPFLNLNGNAGLNQYTATVDWGDDSSSTALVVKDPNGTYFVLGTHTYAESGGYTIHVTTTDGTSPFSGIQPSICEAFDNVTIVDMGETF